MKQSLQLFLLLLFFGGLSACGAESGSEPAPSADTIGALADTANIIGTTPLDPGTGENPAEAANLPRDPGSVDARIQEVRITVGPTGYRPQQVVLETGVPARLIFTRTHDDPCTNKVQIPAFGIEKTGMPMNEEVVIQFTPDVSGAFSFSCGQEPWAGTIVVRS